MPVNEYWLDIIKKEIEPQKGEYLIFLNKRAYYKENIETAMIMAQHDVRFRCGLAFCYAKNEEDMLFFKLTHSDIIDQIYKIC